MESTIFVSAFCVIVFQQNGLQAIYVTFEFFPEVTADVSIATFPIVKLQGFQDRNYDRD